MNDEVDLKTRLTGITAEVGAGIGTDVATSGLLLGGPLGVGLYGAINFGQGAVTNYMVQKHLYGQDKVNWGEVLASGAMGAIPFLDLRAGKFAKYVGRHNTIKRGMIGGSLVGLGGEQLRVGIDEKRLLSPTEAIFSTAIGGGVGGIGGGISQSLAKGRLEKQVNELRAQTEARLGLKYNLLGAIQGYKNRPSAVNTAEFDTIPKLLKKMEDVAAELEYDVPENTIEIKTARKLKPGQTLDKDQVQSVYVAHETAYWRKLQQLRDADPNFKGNLETFPDLIHEGETFRPYIKTKFGILETASVDRYNDRVARRAQGKSNRLQDLSELNRYSGGSTRTFLEAKKEGLDKINAKLIAEGKDPFGDYILDGDHRLPVAATARYGKGLSPKNKKIVYNAIRAAGGALGDEKKNVTMLTGLINRQKVSNLSQRLKKLNHKPAKSFKTQKARVIYYTTPSERTLLTPIEEYVQAAYLSEVWAEEQFNAILKALPVMKKGIVKKLPKEQYDLLVEIFGSKSGINDFIDRMDNHIASWVENVTDYDGKSLIISKEELAEMVDSNFLKKLKDEFVMGELEYRLQVYYK
tara:strand:+ start:796 stop:2532 length:1737 start_codon:yes stop_codon:yes gene_type:complete